MSNIYCCLKASKLRSSSSKKADKRSFCHGTSTLVSSQSNCTRKAGEVWLLCYHTARASWPHWVQPASPTPPFCTVKQDRKNKKWETKEGNLLCCALWRQTDKALFLFSAPEGKTILRPSCWMKPVTTTLAWQLTPGNNCGANIHKWC